MKVSGLREYSELSVRQVIQVIFEATIHHFVRRNNARLVVSQRLPRSHFPGRLKTLVLILKWMNESCRKGGNFCVRAHCHRNEAWTRREVPSGDEPGTRKISTKHISFFTQHWRLVAL
jgi:hypothetical protein